MLADNQDTPLREQLDALRLEFEAYRRQAAVAFDELRLAERTQAAIFSISEAAHATIELDALFQRIHTSIAGLIPAENLFIALYDPSDDVVSFPYFVDAFDAAPVPRKLGDRGLTQQVIRSGNAVLMTPEMRAKRISDGESIVGSVCMDWLGVPLESDGSVIGAIVVQSYSGAVRYGQKDKELLQFVALQVATAIVRKQAFDRITQLALHDPLTGLANRALWQERLRQAIAEAQREQTVFAVLCLDLNRFKPVNDQYGHAVGDQVLIDVAIRAQSCVRQSDTVARLGGDEFSVLLRHTRSPHDVQAVVNKLVETIAKPMVTRDSVTNALTLQISVSVGVALYPSDGQNGTQLMKAADAALYRNKPCAAR
jgi:diguanylate cyclase (GGDEF)-like protein